MKAKAPTLSTWMCLQGSAHVAVIRLWWQLCSCLNLWKEN